MNKNEFIGAIAANAGLSKVIAKKAVYAFFQEIENTLKGGGRVIFSGFGTFSITEKAARKGINPRTKTPLTIAARKVVKFKASDMLSNAVI